jgi:hypothetical protein
MSEHSTPHTHGGTDAPECTPYGTSCRSVGKGAPRLVRQEHDYGCGIATLAMLTGQTYEAVRTWILSHWQNQIIGYESSDSWLRTHGVTGPVLDWYLATHGYVWRKVYSGWKPVPWPPEPFAPVHAAQVIQPSGMAHFVVLTSAGRVLDPMQDEPRSLSEWEQINFVQGVWTPPTDHTEATPGGGS